MISALFAIAVILAVVLFTTPGLPGSAKPLTSAPHTQPDELSTGICPVVQPVRPPKKVSNTTQFAFVKTPHPYSSVVGSFKWRYGVV
jgi:hypothetical protein